MLPGRVTHQDWAPHWPTPTDEPYASHINRVPTYVVSTTLDRANVPEELARLRAQPGGTVGIGGSPTLVASLRQRDLLDELLLLVHPVVVGGGKRRRLADARASRTGVAILTYRP